MEPDFDAMQAEYIASKKHNGSRTAIKVEQTHSNIVKDIYLSEENKKVAKTTGKQPGHHLSQGRQPSHAPLLRVCYSGYL